MIRVLHIVGSMDRNGLQTFIMNVYRNIDKNRVQFDFIEFRDEACDYDEEICNLGGVIYRLPSKSAGFFKCMNGIRKIVRENNYIIVHRHYYSSTMVFELLASKMGGAKVLISHSHSTRAIRRSWLHYVFRPLLSIVATRKLSCSVDAGKWMYGKRKFEVIKNGIDYNTYKFNNLVRNVMRNKLNLSKSYVIGNVARFDAVKNHEFMIKVFEQYLSINDKAVLVLVGDGNDFERIKSLVNDKDLNDHVLFVGSSSEVADYLQAFDVFILPSKYEGIPLTLIEAQVSGLKCIVSNKVDREVDITGNVSFIGIDDECINEWCKELLQVQSLCYRKPILEETFDMSGYSSKNVTAGVVKLYEESIR